MGTLGRRGEGEGGLDRVVAVSGWRMGKIAKRNQGRPETG
jgi:hypothetical protein